jgi:hypothetical protein
MRTLRSTLSLLLLAACGVDAPKQYRVPDVRILAIRNRVGTSAFADADRDELVNVEALVANPLGRAPITVEWYGCLPWIPSLGAPPPPCLDGQRLAHPDSFAATPGVTRLGGGVVAPGVSSTSLVTIDLLTVQPAVDATFAALVAAAGLDPSLKCRLYAELPVVAIARAEGIAEVAVKRVRLSPIQRVQGTALEGIYARNVNPAIGTIYVNPTADGACATGQPLSTPLPPGEVTLCATASANSAQVYNQCQPDGSLLGVEEALEFQWYVSAGAISGSSFSGNAVGGDVKLTPPAGPFTTWAILRDGRGGADWRVLDLAGP